MLKPCRMSLSRRQMKQHQLQAMRPAARRQAARNNPRRQQKTTPRISLLALGCRISKRPNLLRPATTPEMLHQPMEILLLRQLREIQEGLLGAAPAPGASMGRLA